MPSFFSGETLLNFPVLQKTIPYARQRAAEAGKDVDFSLTTNATLLKPEIIEFLAEERRALGERWFLQEYLTEFSECIDSVFSYSDIQAALSDEVQPLFPVR